MKKVLFGVMTLAASVALLSFMAASVDAATIDYSYNNYTQEEAIEDDIYISSEKMLIIEEMVDGDAFLAGETVVVKGLITGDLYVGGADVRIEGDVLGSVFVGGGKVRITGNIGRNLFVGGGDVSIDAVIGEDLMASAGSLKVDGKVLDDVRITGGTVDLMAEVADDVMMAGGVVNITGSIGGDVHVGGGKLSVDSEMVGGDLTAYGDPDMIYVNDDSVIGGEFEIKEEYNNLGTGWNGEFVGGVAAVWSVFGIFWWLLMGIVITLGYVILGYVMSRVAPVKMDKMTKQLVSFDQIMTSFGVGLLAVPVFFFAVIILAVSFVGWPLLGVILALAVVASQLTVPIVGYAVGKALFSKKKVSLFASLFVGVLLVQVFRMLPIIGGVSSFLVFFVGIGAMIRMKRDLMADARGKVAKK